MRGFFGGFRLPVIAPAVLAVIDGASLQTIHDAAEAKLERRERNWNTQGVESAH